MLNDRTVHFEKLRMDWATKYTPSKETIDLYRSMDQRRNPHNEPYHNKAPRRSDAEIISDLCFTFADEALKYQYGREYLRWLEENYVQEPHNKVYKLR